MLGDDGTAHPDGHRWDSDEAGRLVRAATLDTVLLEHSLRQVRFDVLPVSLVTDGALDHLAAVNEGDPVELIGYWTLVPADLSLQIGDGRPAWIPPNDGADVVAPRGSVIPPATPSG
jgi:hypothetical protein